jgi:predicted transcriptional regulator
VPHKLGPPVRKETKYLSVRIDDEIEARLVALAKAVGHGIKKHRVALICMLNGLESAELELKAQGHARGMDGAAIGNPPAPEEQRTGDAPIDVSSADRGDSTGGEGGAPKDSDSE